MSTHDVSNGCRVSFNLYSNKPKTFLYSHEKYDMPCAYAIDFLKGLDKCYQSAPKFLPHIVKNMKISKEDGTEYTEKEKRETPRKSAGKIKNFVECGLDCMPK